MNGNKCLGIDSAGMDLPDATRVLWRAMQDVKYRDGIGGDVMTLHLREKGLLGSKFRKIRLPGIKGQRGQCKAARVQYWHRHKVACGR